MPDPKAPLQAASPKLGTGVGVRSHAPGRPTPALLDGARFDRSSYAFAFLTRQGECQAEWFCSLRGAPPSSDTGKGEGEIGVRGGWKDHGTRKAEATGWTNRQSTFAAAREGDSEREKEARWRLASSYVGRHAAACVRRIPARPPHGAETAGSREDSVAAQPRRKPAAPLAGRREFLRLEFALQGKDFV